MLYIFIQSLLSVKNLQLWPDVYSNCSQLWNKSNKNCFALLGKIKVNTHNWLGQRIHTHITKLIGELVNIYNAVLTFLNFDLHHNIDNVWHFDKLLTSIFVVCRCEKKRWNVSHETKAFALFNTLFLTAFFYCNST